MSTQNILLTQDKMFCSISGQMKCFIWQDSKQRFSFSSYCARSRLWKAPSLRNKSQNGAFFYFFSKKSFFKARSACQDDCLMGTHTCPCLSSPWTDIKPPHGCAWCLRQPLVSPPTCPAPWMGSGMVMAARSCPATPGGDPDNPDTHAPSPGPCNALPLMFSNCPLSHFCVLEKHVVDFPMSTGTAASFWSNFGDLYLIRQ